MAVNFSCRELGLIARALPGCKKHRLGLLHCVLREWGRTDLPGQLRQRPEPTEERTHRRARLERVDRAVREVADALAALDERDCGAIRLYLACPLERYPKGLSAPNIERANREFGGTPDLLSRLAAAARDASVPIAPRPGRVRNDVPYVVLLDIAAIFKWATGKKATRQVGRGTREDCGAFHQFAAAIWPVVFGKGDDGLSSALQSWAADRTTYRDTSALILNIALRRPTWDILP
jgi:hypothetical protein